MKENDGKIIVYGLQTRYNISFEWSKPVFYKTKSARRLKAAVSQHSDNLQIRPFDEKKTLQEFEVMKFQD